MRKCGLFILLMTLASLTFAQTKDEKLVAEAVEKLRKAMVDADKATLESLVSEKLSYGHSPGYVENKQEFVGNILNNKSDFVSLDLTNQTINISNKVAVVRNKFDAVTNNDGKPSEAHLLVLMIWQKKGGEWKLLARQAVKPMVVERQ